METATPTIAPLVPSTGTRPIPITRETFTEALHLAVVQRGSDYVYKIPAGHSHCVYWTPENGPSCLIGLVLCIMGYEDAVRQAGCVITPASAVLRGLGVTDVSLTRAANTAQATQDAGVTYGTAEARFLVVLNA